MVALSYDKTVMAIAGGSLIALASSLNYLIYGKITDVSCHLFTSVSGRPSYLHKPRLCFIVGLITIVDLFYIMEGEYLYGHKVLDSSEKLDFGLIAFGAFLVGLGVRCGGGCTSGHGICGLPRLSIRSIVAVPTFMLTGMLTATFMPTLSAYLPSYQVDFSSLPQAILYSPRVLLTLSQSLSLFYILTEVIKAQAYHKKLQPLSGFICGMIFGLGLTISGMTNRHNILSFLTIDSNWDPSLMFVMMSAAGLNFLPFQYMMKRKNCFDAEDIDLPYLELDWMIFAGPAIFGVGWGITGFCPGPTLANITVMHMALPFVVMLFLGQLTFEIGYGLLESVSGNKVKTS